MIATLAPIGVALLLAVASGFIGPDGALNEPRAVALLWLGGFLIFLPLIGLFGGWLWYRWIRPPKSEKFSVGIISRLLKRGIRHDKSISVQTPDPTSLEFAKAFRCLFKSALAGKKTRRVLIVVDNLDRMEPDQAKRIWSTLQTFLEFSNSTFDEDNNDNEREAENWMKQVWVLVPYAVSGMEAVWNSNGDAATNFMEKRIQVRFHVPPPILTDSGKYLDSLLEKAFPDHRFHAQLSEKSVVRAVYASWTEKNDADKDLVSTPRQMKQFVNGIGALHRIFGDQHQLGRLAYYHAVSREISGTDKLVAVLRSGAPPRLDLASIVSLGPSEATAWLSSILFSAEEKIAVQMLLRPIVDRALSSGDGEALREASEAHGEAFFTTLISSTMIGRSQSQSPNILLNSATAMHRSKLETGWSDGLEFRGCMDVLESAISRVQDWPDLQLKSSDDFVSVVELFREESVAESLLDSLSQTAINAGSHMVWLNSVGAILKASNSIELQLDLPVEVIAKSDFSAYVDICESIVDSGQLDSVGSNIIPDIGDQEVADRLPDMVRETTEEANARVVNKVLQVLGTRGTGSPSQELVSAAYENLKEQRMASGAGASDLVSILERSDSKSELASLAEHGILLTYFRNSFSTGDFDPAANLILHHLLAIHDVKVPIATEVAQEAQSLITEIGLNPDQHPDFVKAFSQNVKRNDRVGLPQLIHILKSNPNWDKWFREIFIELGTDVPAVDQLSFEEMSEDFDLWISVFPGAQPDNEDLRAIFSARIDDERFYSSAISVEPTTGRNAIAEYVATALLDQTQHRLRQNEITGATKSLRALVQLIERMKLSDVDLYSNSSFYLALGSTIAACKTDETVSQLSDLLNVLGDRLDPNSNSDMWSRVRDDLNQADSFPQNLFFEAFGQRMTAGLSMWESPQPTMDLMFRVAGQLSVGGLRWISKFDPEFTEFFEIPEINRRLGSLVSTIESAGSSKSSTTSESEFNSEITNRTNEYEAVAEEVVGMLWSMASLENK